MTEPQFEADELDAYLAEAMEDPAFRLAYERAEWVDARWYRRLANHWAPWLLPRVVPERERFYEWRYRLVCVGWRGRGPGKAPARALWLGRHCIPLPTWFGTMDLP